MFGNSRTSLLTLRDKHRVGRQPPQVARSHQNLVDDSACPLGPPWLAQRLQMPHREAHVLTHPPCSVDSDACPASSAGDDHRGPATTPNRLHNDRATSVGFCGLNTDAAIAASSRDPSGLQRSSEQQLSGQQNIRTEQGVVVVRECEKEQEVRSGMCTWNTEAENRGRDLGCVGEPAQLSRLKRGNSNGSGAGWCSTGWCRERSAGGG